MDEDEKTRRVEARYIELKANPYFDGADEKYLRQAAKELIETEIEFNFKLDSGEIAAVQLTLFRAESFLRKGERHMGWAFYPELEVLNLEGDKLASAVRFMQAHKFRLNRRDLTANHQGCPSCHAGQIGLYWQADAKQLIYTTS